VTEINLREEFDKLMSCKGHWAALRRRVGTRHSSDVNPGTEEGEDLDNMGSGHKHQDFFIEIRKRTLFARGEKETALGKIGEPLLMFYVRSGIKPARHDFLLELAQEEHADGSMSLVEPFRIVRKYDILDVDEMRELGGRVEFFQVYVQELALGDEY